MGALIKQKLAAGEVVRVFNLGVLMSPLVVDVVAAHGGFDAVWLEHEHVGSSPQAAGAAARAARAAGLDSFVRIAATDYATTMRFLEYGAGGVMGATINSAEQAELLVRWSKFAPRGRRGMAAGNVDANYGLIPMAEYARRVNEEVFVAVQVETAEAVENVEAIARVPDVDIVFVGPADLSQSLGVTGEFEHPRCLAAVDRVAKACADAGRSWGILPPSPTYARRMLDRGCQMLVYGSDLGSLHRGIEATKDAYAECFAAPSSKAAPVTSKGVY